MSPSLIQRGLLEELGKWIKTHSQAFYNVKRTEIIGNKNNFVLRNEKKYAFISDVKTWGDENVIKKSEVNYVIFENFQFSIKSISWCEDASIVDFTQDLNKTRLIIKPTPFPYGEAQITRVLKIEI